MQLRGVLFSNAIRIEEVSLTHIWKTSSGEITKDEKTELGRRSQKLVYNSMIDCKMKTGARILTCCNSGNSLVKTFQEIRQLAR